jgi:hypothetical protein
MLAPEVLFLEAVDVLKNKCQAVLAEIGNS